MEVILVEDDADVKELYIDIRIKISVIREIAIRSPSIYYTMLMEAVNSLSDAAFVLEKILHPRNEVHGRMEADSRRGEKS